ncbi:MAG: hypothetical protein EAZ42_04300 [Verrucomicrobia bacterium]|nr:MAG: hypothetical protein EAZ42_04300 [Verrucomicrobiota bacterium]
MLIVLGIGLTFAGCVLQPTPIRPESPMFISSSFPFKVTRLLWRTTLRNPQLKKLTNHDRLCLCDERPLRARSALVAAC